MEGRMTIAEAPKSRRGEPAWDIARLFPEQGEWSEEEYLALTNGTNHLVEFSNGFVEVLPMPTLRHQLIVLFLYRLLFQFVMEQGKGIVVTSPLRVRLWEGKVREPDIVVMLAAHRDRVHDAFFEGADLVVEVVSEDDPQRDLVTKRDEYAQAAIPEYWIVEPKTETITVLRLEDQRYVEHGVFQRGALAASALLSGFEVAADAVFDSGAAAR
jgi:Uma2 family endonuclease